MLNKLFEFLKPQPIEEIVAKLDRESLSVAEGIFETIRLKAIDGGFSRVRIVDQPDNQFTVIFYLFGSEWKDVGHIPSDLGFLKRTRMVTNSKGIADSRLPENFAHVELRWQGSPRRFEVRVTADNQTPQDILEFEVSEVGSAQTHKT